MSGRLSRVLDGGYLRPSIDTLLYSDIRVRNIFYGLIITLSPLDLQVSVFPKSFAVDLE